MDAFTVGLALVFLLLVYKFGTRNHGHWHRKGVESVGAVPFFGSLWPVLSLREHMSDFFSRHYNEHKGKKILGYYQGNTPGLLVLDPELIKSIFITDFPHFVDHGFEVDPDIDPMQSRNLFNMGGHRWKKMRHTLSPTFTSGRIKAMFPLVHECCDTFENYLKRHQHQDLNIKDLLARFTTDVIASCAFGLTVNSVENPNDAFREMGRKLFENDFVRGMKNTCIFFLPSVAKIFKFSFLTHEMNTFYRSLVRDVIEKRTESGNTRKDFMQLLIQLKEKGKLGSIDGESEENYESAETLKLTDDDIVAQVVVFFVGGFETSSSALTFALMELARHPEVQQKARHNIAEVLKRHGGEMSYQALQEMTYLDKIFQEALRMYPPVPFLNRVCTKNYTIPQTNVFLEKGTVLLIPTRALQNDPQYFEDPDIFNPDRFNDENSVKNKNLLLAFGDGPRQCIGIRFAKMQSKLGLFAILRHFEVLQPSKTVYPPVIDQKQFFLSAKDEICIQLKEILSVQTELQAKMDAFSVALVVIFILLVYKFSTRNHGYWRRHGVESVDAVPFVGCLWPMLSLREHMSDLFSRLYYENKGKRFVGYYQGNTPGLLVLDPELIKSIVISDFSHFVDHGFEVDPHNDPMQSRNLFNMSGQQWKEMRNLLSPTFTSGRIKAMFPLVYECAGNFEKYLRRHQNQDLDIKDLLARFTTDIIGSCAFGLSVNSLENPNDKFREMGRKVFEVDFIQGIKINCIFFAPSVARFFRFSFFSQELSNFFRNLVKDIIEERLKSGNTRKDFMQLLIQLKMGQLSSIDGESEEMNGSASTLKLTDDDIVAQAVVFFIGGFETSATTLSFALMEIARNPEVQQKARDNIEEVLKRHGGEVTYQAIQEMIYLDDIVQEALRMYPPVGNLNRVCTKNYNIPGTKVFLEKGTLLVIPNRALQTDPEYFEDPQKFNPDRFTDEKSIKNKSLLLAFGDGPRHCIGMRFAKLQSKLGLFAVLRHFEVLESPKTVYPPVIDPRQFVLTSKDNIYVKLREIQK
ncbi:uncharacterized protein LOC135938386 [Cloeon dipterum]|uniref:uncharacterized protein LOC135938386 n=1 Tax=Cloeon dipterum TaxID=197152 RepID=UPI003220782B